MLRSLLLPLLLSATGLQAQSRPLQLGASIGLVSQSSPAASESGMQGGLSAIRWLNQWLGFGSTLDIARTSVKTRVSVCYFYNETYACFRRPDTESVLSASSRLQLRIPGDGGIRPRASFGAAWNRSVSDPNPGERRTFFTPEFEGGIAWGVRPQGLVSIRVRNLNRWSGVTHGQGGLLIGILW